MLRIFLETTYNGANSAKRSALNLIVDKGAYNRTTVSGAELIVVMEIKTMFKPQGSIIRSLSQHQSNGFTKHLRDSVTDNQRSVSCCHSCASRFLDLRKKLCPRRVMTKLWDSEGVAVLSLSSEWSINRLWPSHAKGVNEVIFRPSRRSIDGTLQGFLIAFLFCFDSNK